MLSLVKCAARNDIFVERKMKGAMTNIGKYVFILMMLLLGSDATAQSFGVLAGLNYSTFNGPTEAAESLGVAGGFHFGVNYSYHMSDLFSLVFELGYTQNGTKQSYNGDSYYIVRGDAVTEFSTGQRDMNLSISNGYLMFPVIANYKVTEKVEVFGGAYVNVLVSPTGRGELSFLQSAEIDSFVNHIQFKQSLDYNYRSDEALGQAQLSNQRAIGVYIDGNEEYFPKVAGAYYQQNDKRANLMNTIDAGLIVGFNYFLNKGFYAGFRLEYGLTDITDERVDISLESLDATNNLIYRDDRDTHLGANISVGFRF